MLFVGGVGFGITYQISTLILLVRPRQRDIAIATALGIFFRVIGGVLGIAILGAIFTNTLKSSLPPDAPMIHAGVDGGGGSITGINDPVLRSKVLAVHLTAFRYIFITVIPFALLAAVLYACVRVKVGTKLLRSLSQEIRDNQK